jgi:hypothetical protein
MQPMLKPARQAPLPSRTHGAAAIEFLLAVGILLLPLLAALFEFAHLGISRQVLQVAAFDAVRAAAVTQGDRGVFTRVLARGVVPLFGLQADSAATAYGRALVELQRPDVTHIEVRSPSRAAFADFAVPGASDRVLPNAGTALIAGRGARSGGTLAQANVLDVRVRHCRRLVVPLMDRLLVAGWGAFASPETLLCLRQRRVPIVVRAVTVMQTPASESRLGRR